MERDKEEKMRKIEKLERKMEGKSNLIEDEEEEGEKMCEVLSEKEYREEIKEKLGEVGRKYKNIKKKLDNSKEEVEGFLRDGSKFEEYCEKNLGWM